MAESLIPEAVKRPPFATYDIVVYFGAGLFSIPFLNRYLVQPFNLKWPNFEIEMGSPIAKEAVSILSMLFFIYIVGHIVAYVSSHLIEKSVDRALGKISTAILLSSQTTSSNRNTVIRALIYNRLTNIRREGAIFSTTVRFFAHLPLIPMYILMFWIGTFGYYNTRTTPAVIDAVRAKIGSVGVGHVDVSLKSKWYKILEYYVINRRPAATDRMYNYLVISGLFRSLSLIFLFSVWMCLYYIIHFEFDKDWFLKPALSATMPHVGVVELVILSFIYMFCLFSYIKFQRRYAEEAIFAFVFGED